MIKDKKKLAQHPNTSDGMKVLLCEDVRTLGWLGDVVEVSNGYARNYLFPQGLAKPATETNLKAIAKEKASRAEQRIHDRSRMEEAAKAVEGAEAVLAAKANEQGVLFGSITAEQVAENLRAQGFEVADDVVLLPEHIKQVGSYTVKLKFDRDLTASVNIVVVSDPALRQAQGGEQSRTTTARSAVTRDVEAASAPALHHTVAGPAQPESSAEKPEEQP